MKIKEIIDSLILEILPLMPSTGEWPFTMISMAREQLAGLKTDEKLFGPFQLLILKRTDYNSADLFDYALKYKVHQTNVDPSNPDILENYTKIIGDQKQFSEWVDRTTKFATELILQISLAKGIQFSPITADLSSLDENLKLRERNLKPYQLFDTYQMDWKNKKASENPF